MKLKAFTLIETILYLALFNVIFFSVITWAISLSQSNRNAEYKNAVEKNAIFVSEHLNDSFRRGLSIDNANSTFNDPNGKVRVVFETGYFEYYRSNNVLKVTAGAATHDLTDKFVLVTETHISPVLNDLGVAIGAKIRVTLVAEKYPTITKTIESYYAFR
jgi:hypothetical protein